MDSVQARPPKRRKTKSKETPAFYHVMPPEIRNEIYEHAALPETVDPEARTFKTVTSEGNIAPKDTVQSFFLDAVSESGRSSLFERDVVKITELTQEVLTLVMPGILFQFSTPSALEVFAETFAAHSNVCHIVPELHIELNLANNLSQASLEELAKFKATKLPHGRGIQMHDHVEKWMLVIKTLPKTTTHVHLVFSHIWRDFRELRGLSKKHGLSERTVTFQFRTPSIERPDHSFFEAQTMAAVKDLEVAEQAGISEEKRAKLVKFGCRGFNSTRVRGADHEAIQTDKGK
ncbi:Uncharacterized protein BP5553_04247 [Venustampulla echinocandica]|uniref:Uncharacterized protein n=1 Tax=Venustampulla echinocandica TaxID=2656787 RepID=A0A370TWK5_9HELO|nr:Uncharacterized protein BP5553_04247 [Venustampulla echinocandica]RDL39907.1 Uncharacterized protein BP5553_04247 [Venustampulla echinocandica]